MISILHLASDSSIKNGNDANDEYAIKAIIKTKRLVYKNDNFK